MISKHIFNSDVVSGNKLWIDDIRSTGDTVLVDDNLKVHQNVDVSGSVYILKNLTVKGTTTTLDTVTVTVDDHNIELGAIPNPTDITAQGGGLTLKGNTDKTFNWGLDYDKSWQSSENLGVAPHKYIFTEKVRARDSGGLFLEDDGGNGIFVRDGGNVGIGTINPGEKLSVEELNSGVHLMARFQDASNSDLVKGIQINKRNKENSETTYFDLSIDAEENKIGIGLGNNESELSNGKADLSNSEIVIDSVGRVGIGMKSPSGTLHLKAPAPSLYITNTTNQSDAVISSNNKADLIFDADLNNESQGTSIQFRIDGSDKMLIDESGLSLEDDLTVAGNLTVNGTVSTINSTTVSVDDKNIELGSVSAPTDDTANGGGITLKGATDKTILWNKATSSWEISENLVVAEGATLSKALSVGGATTLQDLSVGGATTLQDLSAGGVITLSQNNAPTTTTNKLYNSGGNLFWSGLDVINTYSSISSLTDTTISSAGDSDLLIYDASNSKWVNSTLTAGNNVSISSDSGGITIESNHTWTDVGGPAYAAGNNGQVLKVQNGALTWANDLDDYITPAAGQNTEIQFNNNGAFGASSKLKFNGTDLICQGDIIAFEGLSSDRRLKNNISNITSSIEKIKQINGVNFEWSEKETHFSGKDVGVIAQEVKQVLPEAVTEKESGYLGVKYEKIIPLLIEAIKDQQKEIEILKSKIK